MQNNKNMISLDDIRNIINEEIADIEAMEPEDGENEITINVMKQHFKTECRVIMNRVIKFVQEQGGGRSDGITTEEAYAKYCIQCMFSHRDYFTEERIMSYEEFKESRLSEHNA